MITGNRNFTCYVENYINKRESLRERPIDLSIKNKQTAFCPNLLFGILSLSSYVDIALMNIISSNIGMNKYKLLGTISIQECLFFSILMKLKREDKLKSDSIENKLIKHIKLKMT